MTRNGINVYTVKELKEVLDELCEKGLGDRIVLYPDYDTEFPASYRTVGSIDTDDRAEECIYLENLSDEDEMLFWEGKND